MVVLSAAYLVAVAVASIFSVHTYQLQRAAVTGLRPAAAVLIQDGPSGGSLSRAGQAEARWRGLGGGERSGVLTTVTAPGIFGAAAGARIPVWLDRSGQPVAPPAGQVVMVLYALIAGAEVAAGAGMALLIVYVLGRACARPAAAGRVGVCVGPDRAPMDNPSLTRTAPRLGRSGRAAPLSPADRRWA